MQHLISQLMSRFTSSWFYRDICSKLPTPFDNPTFAFLLTALVTVILAITAKEFVSGMIWRLRHVKQAERLKAERAETDRRMEEREQQLLDIMSAFAAKGIGTGTPIDDAESFETGKELETVTEPEKDSYEWPLEEAEEPDELQPATEEVPELKQAEELKIKTAAVPEDPETGPSVDTEALLLEKIREKKAETGKSDSGNEFDRIIFGIKEREEQNRMARELTEQEEKTKAANLAKLESVTRSSYRVEEGRGLAKEGEQ